MQDTQLTVFPFQNAEHGGRALVASTDATSARARFEEYFGFPADAEWDQVFEGRYVLISTEDF